MENVSDNFSIDGESVSDLSDLPHQFEALKKLIISFRSETKRDLATLSIGMKNINNRLLGAVPSASSSNVTSTPKLVSTLTDSARSMKENKTRNKNKNRKKNANKGKAKVSNNKNSKSVTMPDKQSNEVKFTTTPIVMSKQDSDEDGEFKLVVRKRQRSKTTIRGTGSNTNLEGSRIYSHFHIFNLAPKTTTEDVLEHLKNNSIANAKCEAMKSRRPEEYSSFKISVLMTDEENVRKPDFWPKGVCLNRFLTKLADPKKQ